MRKIYLLFAALVIAGTLSAQQWTEKKLDKSQSFYSIQQAFNTYWANKDKTVKSQGYKVFKRWEHMVEPRVYPSGDLALIATNGANYKAFLATYQASQTNSSKTIGQNQSNIASSTWTLVGPLGAMTGSAVNGLPRKAGRDNFVTFLPGNTSTFWAGAPVGGLWKTTNGGTSWTTNTDLLNVIGCSDLAVDPTNTTVLYLATGDGDAGDCPSIGVLKSTNGGTSWSTTGLSSSVSSNLLIRRILVNPVNSQTILAATNAGIYRSANGGTNWTQINTVNTYDMEFKPGDPNTVYATGSTFYLSTNGGASFTQISSGIPTSGSNRMSVAVTTHSSGTAYVYVIASSSSNSGLLGVYQSTNSGTSFAVKTSTPDYLSNPCDASSTGGQGWYDLAIAASPLNPNEVVIGGVNHWKSTNAGSTWTCIGCWNSTISNPPYVHADVHELEYNSAGTLYSANDGGIYAYTGSSWTDVTGSRNIAQIYRIGLSSLSPNYWITGHQDNGSNIYNGSTYAASYPGDGLDCFVDRTNNNVLYTETPNGGLVRSTNGGSSWTGITTGLSGSTNWLTPWKQDPSSASTIYVGLNTVWKSTNQGTSWTSLAALSTTAGAITEFAIAPSNNQVIYVLKTSGIWKTTNGGTTWANITGTVPVGSAALTYVTISSTDPNKAWVTMSGYSNGNKVYKTTNGGTSWTNVSTNLPNIPANCVVYEPGSNDRVYVGMDVGVYYVDNTATNWTLYNTSLPNTVVNDLEISPASPGRLRAATYGRGVYEVDVPCTATPTLALTNQTICPGGSATLTVSGAYTYTWSTSSTATSVVVSPTATTVYSVDAFAAGCNTTGTVSITVSNLSLTAGNQTICSGGTATLTAGGASNYTWSTGGTVPTITVAPSVNTVYTFTGSTGTCVSTKTVSVSVTGSLGISANSSTVCAGGSAVLTASGASTYTWSTGGLTSTVSVSPSVTTVYTVTGNNGSCLGSTTSTVSVNPVPSVSVSSSSGYTFCSPAPVCTLVPSGACTYAFSGGSNTVIPVSGQSYTIIGSSCAGCPGAAVVTPAFTVYAQPTLNISASTSTVCSGGQATITASGANTYTWNTSATGSSIVVTPTASSNYSFVAEDIHGCTGASGTVSVNVVPSNFISVNNQTVCSGGTATLIASGAGSYSWSTGGTSSVIAVSPTANTVYTVSGTNGSCSDTKTVSVTIGSALSLQISSTATSVCSGGSVTLTANGATSYTWSTGSNATSIVINPTVSGTYILLGISGLCTGSTVASVSITPPPVISINASPSVSLCVGASATLSASGAGTYTWSNGSNSNSIVVSPSSSTVYLVTGGNSGCTATQSMALSIGTGSIALGISASSTSVCVGGSATLTASGASTYTWSTGSNNSVIVVSPTAGTTYTLNGSNGGCSGATVITLNTSVAPTVSISAFPSNTICAGGSVTLTANGPYTNYSWSNPAQTGASIVVSPTTNVTYTINASGGSTGCSTNTTVQIGVGNGPVSIISTTNSGCAGSCSGIINVTTSGGNGPYTYSLGGTSCVAFPCASLCPGLYNLYTYDSQGCSMLTVFTIASSTNNLVANVSGTNSSCGSCANGVLSANPAGGNAPYSYTWIPAGGNAATATSLTPGCYTVNILDATGCALSARACVGIEVGFENLVMDAAALSVFPNPAKNELTVSYEGYVFGVTIYNSLGQMVYHNASVAGSYSFDVSQFARGVYVLEAKMGKSTVRRKLVLD